MELDASLPGKPMPRDDLAVRALLAGYAHAVDGRDLDALLELFHPDIVFVMNNDCFEGHEGAGRFLAKLGPPSGGMHFTANIELTLQDPDRIAARSNFAFLRRKEDGQVGATLGRYEDVFVRYGAGWRFIRRALFTL